MKLDEAPLGHPAEATMNTPKALSILQPWAWLIIHGGKDVENRPWGTAYRGPLYIHASTRYDPREWNFAQQCFQVFHPGETLPDRSEMAFGAIIGRVEMTDCVSRSDSVWFLGPYGFVLSNPQPLGPLHCHGALSFWIVPPDVLRLLEQEEYDLRTARCLSQSYMYPSPETPVSKRYRRLIGTVTGSCPMDE